MGTRGVTVRRAVEADRPAILSLAPRLAEGVAPWRDQEEALAAGARWLEDSLAAAADGTGAVFVANVAESGGTGGAAGVITVRPARHFTGEHDGYIGELAVGAHASRQGIGRALIEAADSWARERGLANLTLHTGAYNMGARAFYAALGFVVEEVRLTRAVGPQPT